MSLEEYQSAWQGAGQTADLTATLAKILRSERRSRLVIAVCACNTVVALLLTGGILLFRRPLAMQELLPAVAAQAILTCALAVLVKRRMARRTRGLAGLPVKEAAVRGLHHVTGELRDLRVMVVAAVLTLPFLALAVNRLMASGKMNSHAALSFATLCGVVLAVNAVIQWRRYFRILLPRRQMLCEIIQSLQSEG